MHVDVDAGTSIAALLVNAGLASSISAARRVVAGGGVRINNEKVGDDWVVPATSEQMVLRVGKKKIENHREVRVNSPSA